MDLARWRRRGRDRLLALLPVLLLGLLALGSWWLVRSVPQFGDAGASRAPSHEPDYVMGSFSVRSFDAAGVLQSELTGRAARHYPDTDTLEVVAPRMQSRDRDGHPVQGRAQRGVSNADASDIKLYGAARIVRPARVDAGSEVPRLEFQGDYLHALVGEEFVQSDQPVQLLQGDDRFTGDRFDYDNRSGVAHLHGQVRGVIQPLPERSQ